MVGLVLLRQGKLRFRGLGLALELLQLKDLGVHKLPLYVDVFFALVWNVVHGGEQVLVLLENLRQALVATHLRIVDSVQSQLNVSEDLKALLIHKRHPIQAFSDDSLIKTLEDNPYLSLHLNLTMQDVETVVPKEEQNVLDEVDSKYASKPESQDSNDVVLEIVDKRLTTL